MRRERRCSINERSFCLRILAASFCENRMIYSYEYNRDCALIFRSMHAAMTMVELVITIDGDDLDGTRFDLPRSTEATEVYFIRIAWDCNR